ncbi:hypothetical protein [Ferrovibrio sp.]|uniref:hypothetical protein n=1 Tax=Ferrovibrio sp. TaxID=1917215 RepID=UPI00351498A6
MMVVIGGVAGAVFGYKVQVLNGPQSTLWEIAGAVVGGPFMGFLFIYVPVYMLITKLLAFDDQRK